MPKAGKGFGINCVGGPSNNTRGLLFASTGTLDVPVTLSGVDFWIDPTRLVLVQRVGSTETGYAEVRFVLPNDPLVVAHVQFFWQDDCAPAGWAASDALIIEIQP